MDQTEQNLLPWLTLKSVPGIGNLLFKRLIGHFGSPVRVLSAPPEALVRVEGVSDRLATAVVRFCPPDRLKRELGLALEKGYRIIPLTDDGYPALLREISDPPPFLYARGNLPTTRRSISIVGSRNATDYGLRMTRRLCRDFADLGWSVVSGMALGIDTAAHEGALAGGGRTVAVLGSGLDQIYPRENIPLSRRISETGAVISELPLQADPDPHHFPARNRIISGMSLGTLVVEAAKRSGSLITARLAAEQNREVFAVPGSVQSFKSSGTHQLIKQGAKLVEQIRDILEELVPMLQDPAPLPAAAGDEPKPLPDLPPEELRVATALGAYPIHIDDLSRQLELPAHTISSILLSLELKGVVCQMPGKYFSRESGHSGNCV
jgi:DNA processing protein